MIRITYSQVSLFNNPAIGKLFNDDKRCFPVDDALRLTDLIDQIQGKLKLYSDQVKKIIEANNGKPNEDGIINYATDADKAKAIAEIEKLNSVQVEITGDKIKPKDTWPNLAIVEAAILNCILEKANGTTS